MDRSWMYDRFYQGKRGKGKVKEVFKIGVDQFINTVKRQPIVIGEGGIRCPCATCQCTRFYSEDEIKLHLYTKGFQRNYWVWSSHGEFHGKSIREHMNFSATTNNVGASSSSHPLVAQNVANVANDDRSGDDEYDADELPNDEAQRFFGLLNDTNKPLFEGSLNSKLTVCVRLLGLKSQYQVPELAMDMMTKLMLDVTPVPGNLPQSYYEANQLLSKLGLGVKSIDCCINGCMLFYNNEFGVSDGELVECKFCQEPRYHATKNSRSSRRKPVPRKTMFYLPIISRLQRMYASMETASKMSWHSENYERRKSSGELQHPSDGLAWKHFDQVHPDFALEPRNVRLGLCFDGFTPYTQVSATSYSCWPVIVTPYNLPPNMCMSKPYMFLAAVIPDPSSPTVGIDIYLQPLVDDLKRLWKGGDI